MSFDLHPPRRSKLAFASAVPFLLFTFVAFGRTATTPSASSAQTSDALRSDPIAYLESKIRVWTRDDAEDALGRPVQKEAAIDIQTQNQIGDTMKYKTPAAQFSEIDLTFDHDTRLLTVAYLYPKGALASSTMRDALGKNFVKFTNPNGMPSYVYQQSRRTISIQADVKDDVVNVMIW
jgi:hypothetical protein